jgi:Zn-dependent protease with chaperone function
VTEPATVRDARGSLRVGSEAAFLALLGIAFPMLFALAVALAGFALVVVIGHFAVFLLKLLWLLLFPLFAALRALWMPPQRADGEPLSAAAAPALFETIARLRAASRAARIDAVYLTGGMNASLAQVPRYGIFGGTRNELYLGLPLMAAMDVPHFTAVLAHEIGHLARRHGSFAARIYRMRLTLDVMLGELEERRSPLVYPVASFYRAFTPRFERVTLELSRAVEREADAEAADAVGAEVAALALVIVHGLTPYYENEVWPAIFRRTNDEPEPPLDVYGLIADQFRSPIADGHRFLATALATQTAETDTHPALGDRLRYLRCETVAIEAALDRYAVPEVSAADAFLSEAAPQRRALADAWRGAVRAQWRAANAEAERVRAQLAELDALGDAATVAQRGERALAAATLNRADAAQLLVGASDAAQQNAELALRAGALLTAVDDERGISYLERAMAAQSGATPAACAIARAFWVRRRDRGRVAECEARVTAWYTTLQAALAERGRFTGAEPIEAHGLDEEQLAPVRCAVALRDVVAAYFARRRLTHLGADPHFVLAVSRTKTRNAASDDAIAGLVSHDLESFPYGVTVVVSSKPRNAVVEALRAVDGTLL